MPRFLEELDGNGECHSGLEMIQSCPRMFQAQGGERWCVCVCVCAQSCLTVDGSTPGSSVRGISQVRILECVAISYSRESIISVLKF